LSWLDIYIHIVIVPNKYNSHIYISALKADRKRLKGEKLELLNQLKTLYGTLEEKEAELRDFIHTYEQRMRDSDDTIKQVGG